MQNNFKVCQYIDCAVDIVTPGLYSKSGNQKVAAILAARTVIEGIFFPVVSEALDINLSPKALTKIFIAAAGPAVNALGNQISNGGNADFAIKTFANVIIADIKLTPNAGPITKLFIAKYGDNFKEQITKRLSRYLIPALGEISLMLDALGFVNGAMNVGYTMASITATPGDLSLEVAWPMQVTGIIPGTVKYDAGPTTLTLTGQGLNKISEVALLDIGQASPYSITLNVRTVTDDHRGASILIPGEFIEGAAGPVRVIAKSDKDPQSESPENLEIETCSPLILDRYRIIDANGTDPQTDCSIVRDTATNLEWQRCAAGQVWNKVSQSCDGAGYRWPRPGNSLGATSFLEAPVPAGWRIPSISELRSIVYCSSGSPAFFAMPVDEVTCSGSLLPAISREAFPNTPSWRFWSTTPAGNNFWWIAHFDSGKVNGGGYNGYYHLRFVR